MKIWHLIKTMRIAGSAYDGTKLAEVSPWIGGALMARDGFPGNTLSFGIDSALQAQAKPSMMKPEGGGVPTSHHHGGLPAAAPAHQAREAWAGETMIWQFIIDLKKAATEFVEQSLLRNAPGGKGNF